MPRLAPLHDWPRVIHLLRTRLNQTQAEFAAAVGCGESTVSKWERGETAPATRHRRQLEGMGAASGYPASEWPEATNQALLFEQAR